MYIYVVVYAVVHCTSVYVVVVVILFLGASSGASWEYCGASGASWRAFWRSWRLLGLMLALLAAPELGGGIQTGGIHGLGTCP